MAPLYDSDSSDDDDVGEYTETKVLLGYASQEPTDDPISQLGGEPVSPVFLPVLFTSQACNCSSKYINLLYHK